MPNIKGVVGEAAVCKEILNQGRYCSRRFVFQLYRSYLYATWATIALLLVFLKFSRVAHAPEWQDTHTSPPIMPVTHTHTAVTHTHTAVAHTARPKMQCGRKQQLHRKKKHIRIAIFPYYTFRLPIIRSAGMEKFPW